VCSGGIFDSRSIYGSWGNAAYSQYGFLPLVQLVSVTGLFGISFLMAWFASLCNWVWEQGLGEPTVRRGVTLYAGVLLAVLLWGGTRLVVFAPLATTVRSASLSRADIEAPPDQTWRHVLARNASPQEAVAMREWFGKVNDDLLARVDREATVGAKIVFWGETNALSYKEDEGAPGRTRASAGPGAADLPCDGHR
jgi:apolipoprotein N-acyltransferase